MAPLASLPVFFKLGGRRVILAGATDGALWKAELLAAAGADLHVFAEEFPEGFAALAADPPAGAITLHARGWLPADLADAVIAIADLEEPHEAEAFVAAARAAGAAFNVIDKPDFCAFQFGAIVNRSPLVIGISTDGAAPVFGQAIRQKIEALLPAGLKAWAEAARDWRPHVQARALAYAARRLFWENFTRRALSSPEAPPTDADRNALLASLEGIEERAKTGRISLVGAGPGDPDLLTVKAIRTLQAADIILHDDLVSPEVLELARREAKRMLVGKKGHGPSCKQSDINDLMVRLAREGRHVVRLKSGDPAIFGRATEELDAARRAGISVTIVPGITAAQGAAASLETSLTERKRARRLQFLTGHGMDGRLPADIAWEAIADETATTVLYMPRKTLGEFRERALAAGLSPEIPAVAVMNATRANERHLAGTLAGLPEDLARWPNDGPVLVMIGHTFGRLGESALPLQAAGSGGMR
ncbi:MAG: uroporphyrinogen-III C-methyltransferase [Methylobacterium sp.]|nr:MAG: uroporphyrinogen-III C-methyltransferase [Methylobacterium sp.]